MVLYIEARACVCVCVFELECVSASATDNRGLAENKWIEKKTNTKKENKKTKQTKRGDVVTTPTPHGHQINIMTISIASRQLDAKQTRQENESMEEPGTSLIPANSKNVEMES